MSQAKLLTVLAVIVVAALLLFWSGGGDRVELGPGGSETDTSPAVDAASSELVTADADTIETEVVVAREAVAGPDAATGVRGRIVDATTREPLIGVEVLAMRRPPGFEQLFARMRTTLFEGKGLWAETVPEPEILGRTTTGAAGEFEILGLPPGVIFLDGRSDFTFVRTPERARLARGEIREGIELVGSPGGRVRGLVTGPDGLPASGVAVTLRPGLNAFLGQVTERQYRWLVAATDADGEFDIPGVPEGHGYTLSAAGPLIALAEEHGIDVEVGKVTRVDVQGYAGATIEGRVLDVDGVARADALVAMAYLDVSRVLFSADGRGEPVRTDADGRFRFDRVASGRVAFIATADGRANSGVEELGVVDGGEYRDVELVLREGRDFGGLVVDQEGKPIAGAVVDIRPMEEPNSPDVLKTLLNIRAVQVETGRDGRFQTAGITARRVFLQTSKPGFVTEVKLRHDVEEEDDVRIELVHGVTVRGRVVDADGRPVERFRVDTRSRPVDPEDERDDRAANDIEAADDEEFGRPPRSERRRWRRGGSIRIAEGQKMEDRGFDGNWREFRADDGRFEITGVPPGTVRVRVRAEGCLEPDNQSVVLAAGERSDELTFQLTSGCVARGTVVDAVSKAPMPDVDVTAYADRERRGGIFQINFDQQDVDFLGMATKNSAKTASDGTFEITGLAVGAHRFTARHPDRAKSSVKEVEVTAEQPTEGIVIEIESGGGIRGLVTGRGGKPLPDALIVAFSMAAGSFKSSSTDKHGEYEIDGLPSGQYAVFKSRIGERAMNLGYDLLGNMRLKTVRVKQNEFTQFDIQDESENTVRVWGVVRDGEEPVAEGMVSALSTDRDGFFGMGLRAQPTDKDGRYELIGLQPGEYFFQVSRFRGQPQQASLSVEVPTGVGEFRVDLELPQSAIRGRVVDTRGEPVAGIRVSAGVQSGGLDDAPGLLGIILKNGIAQDRTDDNGEFEIDKVAAGTYRLSVSGRQGRRAHRKYGEASVEDVVVDGSLPVENVELTLPLAGRVTGTVVDGSGSPVAGAEIHYERQDVRQRSDPSEEMLDLLGMQIRPEKSGADGTFELSGLSPGTYRVRADADGLAPGVAEDVLVAEESVADVALQVVVGAKVRIRATNVDGSKIPFASISVLDGKGKPLAKNVSVMSVFRRMMGRKDKVDDSGWYEVGNIPPDTYTVIIREKDQPEVRVTHEIRDGEEFDWDIDVTAELEAQGRARK